MTDLAQLLPALAGVRFSPMSKPAAEVAEVTGCEAHGTRARLSMLWRIAAGHAPWTPRAAEILYESTLDSIAEAYEVYHPPIAAIMAAGRADARAKGFVPEAVAEAIRAIPPVGDLPRAQTLLLLSDAPPLAGGPAERVAAGALAAVGKKAEPATVAPASVFAALGDAQGAAARRADLRAALARSGVREVIAADADTLADLRQPDAVPAGTVVTGLASTLLAGRPRCIRLEGKVQVLDCRAALRLADGLPQSRAIMPGFPQEPGASEQVLGTGAVYDELRRLVDATGADRVWNTWSRALARSSGADDALWRYAPALAARLAAARLSDARALGVATIVTGSARAAGLLRAAAGPVDPDILWHAELIDGFAQ